MTPIQYLNFYRIEMAADLLKNNPDLTVTKTAFACGFNSSQYFATAFKQQKGCTPRKYRK
jgi:AraC family L-rhamnose operon regulatory protein RhaS